MENLTVSLMKKHFTTGIVWDQEFPSMCSYGSDYDPSKSPGLRSESVLATPKLDPEHMNQHSLQENELAYSDLDSCCTNQPLQFCSYNMIHQKDDKIYNPDLLQEPDATKHRGDDKSEKRRRGRNNISMSASIPSDVRGVVAESIAVVKLSCYPYDDFQESILRMIGNNKLNLMDLEELLYCYFSLNSPENYDLIREAFFDAWNQLLCYHGVPLDLL
ncbi:hypothetical protein O6H91_01G029000 [Diphasiastrum complanatum]|nr:hypothetical protein O6H91_01G029000 [Diphasiastrum complanatum]